jgi:TolA-binding protein
MQTVPTSTPDPLLETQVFWDKYKMPILFGILAVLLVIGAISAFRFFAARKNAVAAELFSNAKGIEDYQKVIAQYPTSGATASAYLLLAAQQREKKQFAEANTSLQTFVDKFSDHQLVTTAKMAIAGNLESLGKPDEALEAYRRLAADSPTSFNAPLAMLAQVPLLKQKGQVDEARRVCETVLTQYRDSYAASEATRLLRSLKPATPPAAAPAPAAPAANAPAPGANVPPVAASPAASVAPTP